MPTLVFAIGVSIGWESTRRRLRAPEPSDAARRCRRVRMPPARHAGRSLSGRAEALRTAAATALAEALHAPGRRWSSNCRPASAPAFRPRCAAEPSPPPGWSPSPRCSSPARWCSSYAPIIGLYESVHTGVLGGVALTLGQLAHPAEPRGLGRVLAGRSRLRDRHGIRRLPAGHPPRPAARRARARRAADRRPRVWLPRAAGPGARRLPRGGRHPLQDAVRRRPRRARPGRARRRHRDRRRHPARTARLVLRRRRGPGTAGRHRAEPLAGRGPSRRWRSGSPPSPACSPCGPRNDRWHRRSRPAHDKLAGCSLWSCSSPAEARTFEALLDATRGGRSSGPGRRGRRRPARRADSSTPARAASRSSSARSPTTRTAPPGATRS